MTDIKLVQALVDKYQTLQNKDDEYIDETILLNILNEELKWNLLSDPEKQQARKERNIELLSKLYKDSDDKHIVYETVVIELYDLIVQYINILESLINDNELLFRLYSILTIEKSLIDQKRRICNVKHIIYELVKSIFLKLEGNAIVGNLNLLQLWNKFEEMFDLLPKAPYRI